MFLMDFWNTIFPKITNLREKNHDSCMGIANCDGYLNNELKNMFCSYYGLYCTSFVNVICNFLFQNIIVQKKTSKTQVRVSNLWWSLSDHKNFVHSYSIKTSPHSKHSKHFQLDLIQRTSHKLDSWVLFVKFWPMRLTTSKTYEDWEFKELDYLTKAKVEELSIGNENMKFPNIIFCSTIP